MKGCILHFHICKLPSTLITSQDDIQKLALVLSAASHCTQNLVSIVSVKTILDDSDINGVISVQFKWLDKC